MNKNLLSLLLLVLIGFSACTSNSGEQATEVMDSSTTWTVNDSTSVSEDTTSMIRFNCFDLPEDKENQLGQLLYLSYKKYMETTGPGIEVLKRYITYKLLDTSEIETYSDHGHIKQRYFFYVFNKLPLFVDKKERHSGYYVETNKDVADDDKLIPYAIYRFDRSPENIRKTFDLVKNELRAYVSPELYKALAIKETLYSLRETYKFIYALDNVNARLDSVYMAVDSVAANFDYEAPTAYGHSLNSDYEIYKKYLRLDKYYDTYPESYEAHWAFSFWMRRHYEKNESEVISIVHELIEIFER